MAGRPACILTLVTAVAVPAAVQAQAADAPSTWVSVGLSGEHARFSHGPTIPPSHDIGGTQPSLSFGVNRLVTRRVRVGVDIDIGRRHERVLHYPTSTLEEMVTLRDRFTTFTAHVGYSVGSEGNWTTSATVGVSFTRSQHSSTSAFVPPLTAPSGRTDPLTSVQVVVGPAVGLEVSCALGERWSVFGDVRVTAVSGNGLLFQPRGLLLRPGFGLRLRL